MNINTLKNFNTVLRKDGKKVVLEQLPYPMDGLEPVISKDRVSYHYGEYNQD